MYGRLIGVGKMSIKKVLRRALISLPDLQTLIKEGQAVVNDRPITFVYHDVNDPEPLTSSKLLYGFEVTALPHPVVDPHCCFSTLSNGSRVSTLPRCGSVMCISLKRGSQEEII